jgi:hypothetical protein
MKSILFILVLSLMMSCTSRSESAMKSRITVVAMEDGQIKQLADVNNVTTIGDTLLLSRATTKQTVYITIYGFYKNVIPDKTHYNNSIIDYIKVIRIK